MYFLIVGIIILPLISAIINGICGPSIGRTNAAIIACVTMVVVAVLASIVFYDSGIHGNVRHIILHNWLTIVSVTTFSVYVDQLTSIMFLIVTIISAVVHVYSLGYMHNDRQLAKFLSYLSLFTFFMLILVSADNLLQLFFGWEGVGFCSYLLIGYWYEKPSANNAAVKAFIVNRIADFALLLGIVLTVLYTNRIDFAYIFSVAPLLQKVTLHVAGSEYPVIDIICLLFMIGCMGKSAQIGLHVWLPDAMEGPTPVSALIHAATMVTAGIFLLARCSYLFEYSPAVLQSIAVIGGVTCLFAASIAIVQSDIKKIIAYSTCSQLGYMFLACGVSVYQGAIFHLLTHAFFKALLFLAAGSVINACHEQNIFRISGLSRRMPITYMYFIIGSLAIVGIFPLSGFYSKDFILESVYVASKDSTANLVLFWCGIMAAALTAIYSMKIVMLVFYRGSALDDAAVGAHESGYVMNMPIFFLVVGAVFAGLGGYYILDILNVPDGYFVNSILAINNTEDIHNIPRLIKLLPTIITIVGILAGFLVYRNNLFILASTKATFLICLLQNKFYIDKIYALFFVKPLWRGSVLFALCDKQVVDKVSTGMLVNCTNRFSWLICKTQTGYISHYIFVVVLTISMCITYFVFNSLPAV